MVEENRLSHISIAERSPQGVPIHLVVERKHDPAAVGVFHLHVAAFPVDFHKTNPLQSCENLSASQKRQLHESSTTSALSSAGSWFGWGSR